MACIYFENFKFQLQLIIRIGKNDNLCIKITDRTKAVWRIILFLINLKAKT